MCFFELAFSIACQYTYTHLEKKSLAITCIKHTSINSVEQEQYFKPCYNTIRCTNPQQRVFHNMFLCPIRADIEE